MGNSIGGFSGAPTLVPTLSSNPATPAFAGLSNYATDLQNALNRSVGLAALPLQILQTQQTQLTNQSSALSALDAQFSALQSTIGNLNSASQNLVSSSVSDSTVLSASAAAGALPGSYTITVTDPGSFSSALSSNGLPTVTDPTTQNISAASSFTLTVNGVPQTITPAANNLNALAAAINANASAGVQATIVNVGPPTAPDYRLSLQSNTLGNVPIQLSAGGPGLLTASPAGTLATYTVNGSPVSSNSRSVTIAPGVTANLLKAGTSVIDVSQSASSISNALSAFTTAFNGVVDELGKSRGQNAGPLSGQGIVSTLTQVVHSVANYSGTASGFTSLADLGLTFDTAGHLNFDPTALSSASGSQIADLKSFLGSSTSGGFLQFATDQLNGVEDSTSGILKTAINSKADEITHENQLISNQQDKISQLQTSLQAKMAAADALIAETESQLSYFTGLFQSMYLPRQSQF